MICPVCQHETEVVDTDQGERFTLHGDCPGGIAFVDLADTKYESRYTPANAWCQHPERWHSDDWDSAESEVTQLVGALVTALRPTLVVETGSAWGQTAEAIGRALEYARVGTLHTIEPDPERADATRKRCEGLPVVVEQMKSLDFTPPGEVGFAWFDSLLELRVPEFRKFYEHLADGAIVGFHDVGPHFGPQMWQALLGEEAAGRLLPIRLRTPRGVCFAEVLRG